MRMNWSRPEQLDDWPDLLECQPGARGHAPPGAPARRGHDGHQGGCPRSDGLSDPRFVSMMRELGKGAAIGVMTQINIIVLTLVASYREEGPPTCCHCSVRRVDVVQGIIAVGGGLAMRPGLSKAVAGSDWEGFERAFVGSGRLAAALLSSVASNLAVAGTSHSGGPVSAGLVTGVEGPVWRQARGGFGLEGSAIGLISGLWGACGGQRMVTEPRTELLG